MSVVRHKSEVALLDFFLLCSERQRKWHFALEFPIFIKNYLTKEVKKCTVLPFSNRSLKTYRMFTIIKMEAVNLFCYVESTLLRPLCCGSNRRSGCLHFFWSRDVTLVILPEKTSVIWYKCEERIPRRDFKIILLLNVNLTHYSKVS